jgi:hypothetical protein
MLNLSVERSRHKKPLSDLTPHQDSGTVWVFILSMIVTMPLLTAWVKRRRG